MSYSTALQAFTQIVFVAIFLLTLAGFIRQPSRDRAEIAVLFGTLAVIIVLGGLTQLTGIQVPAASLVGALLLLAQPYLLLRLVAHFRSVPTLQHVLSLIAMAVSWAVVIWMMAVNIKTSTAGTLAIVVAFGYVEGYASFAFIRAAFETRGVTQRRLVAVALGAGFLATVILMAGVGAFLPQNPVLKVASDLLGLASAISYYIGFAPPAWLRRTWQIRELQIFLSDLVGRSAEDRFAAALDQLGPAAARALGGKAAIVALGDESSSDLAFRRDPENNEVLPRSGLAAFALNDSSSLLARAWRERRNIASNQPDTWGTELRQVAAAFGGAGSVLVSPLAAHGRLHGLLVVLFAQHSVFFESEFLLAALAEQAALSIAGAHLVGQLQEQNVALEAASRMKSDFLANMSHELRTPLNAILGFSELLMDARDGDVDTETEATYLERIHDSGRHLLDLINDILDLSKIEAGRMDLHPEQFAVSQTIGQVLSTVEPLADRKHIDLASSTADAGDLYADAGKFKQILYNLLSNAIKFTPENGRVTVDAWQEDGSVHVAVKDTGIGIAPADQERVFAEFQQVDSGANRKHEGTGLGLALTKRFVEMHDGRIWLESQPGSGACFHVTMPLVTPPQGLAREDELPAPSPAAEGPLVLVVEDNAAAAHLMAVYLSRGGYQVETASDGRQAVEKARRLRPAAVTLDIMLPRLDGWQVLRELKAGAETRDIPVIIASIIDDQPLGYALGATDYLIKPIDREMLLARLARYTLTSRAKAQGATVLVVDDDPSARQLLAGMLEPASFTVIQASSGTEALEHMRQQPPDVVLLDLMMPGMSGFDVVTSMRLDPTTQALPVLIVTAKELTSQERQSLNGSVAGVFTKASMSQRDLLVALRQLLSLERQPEELSHVTA